MPAENQWSALHTSISNRVVEINKYSSQFGQFRIYSKAALIVLSAIVAGDKSVISRIPHWHGFLAIFAILVAIGTALDAWIKPAEKWRISSTYATQFDSLLRAVEGLDHNDLQAIKELDSKFQALEGQWLKDTTY